MVIIPLLLMLFAFAMERIESSFLHSDAPKNTEVKLAKDTVSADGIEEYEVQEASAA
ncbi:hypothetical protein N24_0419 [Corynebacterium suranareeae]|uniref:Uncharacterized protein n=1 Tax=Corynebacterium suranareeae TaxID=2506452 RepID=A0A160PPU5_9CORY|nr:hypothetical protein N24_0419 [Corynebacterium suranareeae]